MIPRAYRDDVDARIDDAARAAAGSVVEFGRSVEGRALRAIVVPSTSKAPSAPTVLVNANLHGVEFVGAEAALAVVAALAGARGAVVRDRAHVVVVPVVNPDGRARTLAQNGEGSIKELRGNARGVDLNRNFPMPHGATPSIWFGSGSSDPASPTWRGPQPFSESETRALDALAQQHRFHAVVSFHSFMGTLIPPKVKSWTDAQVYRKLCRTFRRSQSVFFYPTFMCAPLDVFTGELEDHLHHVHGAWAVTVELFPIWRSFRQAPRARSLFQRFNPDDPGAYVDDAVAGCLAYLAAALDVPRPSSTL